MQDIPNINLSSFHDYDVRGIYGEEIDERFFYHLGKSIAQYVGPGTTIGVGRDARPSSPSLTENLIKGVTDYGCNVVNLGEISTEIHYYVSGKYRLDANVIVTASHNPPEYNGAKIVLKDTLPLHGGFGLPEIKELMNQELPVAAQKGSVSELSVLDEYVKFARTLVDTKNFKKLKVVVDAGNGMGGPVWQKITPHLKNIEIIPLHLDVDCTFPNHPADPIKKENTEELSAKVVATKADFGIALDGDADRIFFVDDKGERLSGGKTLALFMEYFLSRGEMGTFVYNASIGRIVPDVAKKYGAPVARVRGGHAFFKAKLRETNGIFGGEHSGHYGYHKTFYCEMTLVFGLMMMDILSNKKITLSEIRKQYDIYPESGEINFRDANTKEVLRELKELFKKEATDISDIDGTAFTLPDAWFIVRSSQTEPLTRLNMDAENETILTSRLSQITTLLEKHGGVRRA